MKSQIIKWFSRFFFPQNIFGKSIVASLKKKKVLPDVIIDAPCGNGETSYHLSKVRGAKILAFDLDDASINAARKNYNKPNINFEVKDIHSVVKGLGKVKVFCMINSLFLLPDQEKLLKNIADKLEENGMLYVIIPNIHSDNYKDFISKNSGVNSLEFDVNDAAEVFKDYNVKGHKALAFVKIYNRNDLKFLSIFSHVYLRLASFVNGLFGLQKPSYYLIELEKK